MLDPKFKLSVVYYDSTDYTDFSHEAFDYGRDPFTVTLETLTDYLYVGYEKPVNLVYVELATPNETANTFTAEYFNGTTWVDLAGFFDETVGFTRSGFMKWDRNQVDQRLTTVNSVSKYWIRLKPSEDQDETDVQGISVVFSDDEDLKKEFFHVASFIPSGQSSHILSHVAARDEIIQKLRKDGRWKINIGSGQFKDIDLWDILEYDQIRNASALLTLSKIFFNKSDAPDDIYSNRSEKFRGRYNETIDTFYIDLDKNDDGLKNREEQLGPQSSTMVRR